nr:RNA dependent RNA polymerase [Erysiphe necator associated totivirus 1]
MSWERVDQRASEAGTLGAHLKGFLDPRIVQEMLSLPYERQISLCYAPRWYNRIPYPIARAATCYLVPDYPVQVRLDSGDLRLLLAATCPLAARPAPVNTAGRWLSDPKACLKRFPLKRNPAAANKVNVFLDEVGRDLLRTSPNLYFAAQGALETRGRGLFNDQASAVLLYGFGLSTAMISRPFEVAISFVQNVDYTKALSGFIKAVGANATNLGSLLCEGNTLLGRDVGTLDLEEEARYRCEPGCRGKLAEFEEGELRAAVRAILEDEIRVESGSHAIDFESLEHHWDRRWEWAVNGAHSGHVSKLYPRVPKPPGMLREHRRAWLEAVTDDPRVGWSGETFVSASEKLEHGKTRGIFACDTVNYLAFEHLMAPVEARWRQNNVILDPGSGGHVGMVHTIASARERAGVSMMLDYDDFNSHHSIASMKILIEETMDLVEYPEELRGALLASFDKTHIYVGDKYIGRSTGTLMSGHRCTTYINSVLNRAYLVLVLGDKVMSDSVGKHVGDDVFFGVRTYAQVGEVCRKLRDSPLRMNPMKQSVGHISTEFLRNATSGRTTYGYFARSVASVVSGNWVSEAQLAPREALNTMITAARSLANRSGSELLPLLLVNGVCRMSGLPKEDHKKLREMLTGRLALDNGPLFSAGGYYVSSPLVVGLTHVDDHGYAPLPAEATHRFLSRASEPLEVDVLTQAGVSVEGAMQEASFRKSLPARFKSYETVRIGEKTLTLAVGSATIEALAKEPVRRGVLSPYPLLQLAKHRLSPWLVRWAVAQAGGDPNAPDLDYEAWGERKHGCIIASPMSYNDAATYGRRTVASVLTSAVNMRI